MGCVTTMSKSNREIFKLIWSFTIGDGHLSTLKDYVKDGVIIQKRNNSKYNLKQKDGHKDYIDYQANILSELTRVNVNLYEGYTCKQGYTRCKQWNLNTLTHPKYTTLRHRIYQDNRKTFTMHDLKQLDALSLAHLYMDDGFTEIQPRKTKEDYVRIGIATHSYTQGDNLLLRKAISEKFGIEFNVHIHRQSKNNGIYYYLRASKDHAHRFLDLIAPHVLKSYQYKLERIAPIN